MDCLSRDSALSVSQVNAYIGRLLESDDILSSLHVRGEISNFKNHPSGHLYFSMKDAGGVIRCVMFRSAAARLKFAPEDGMKIVARGSLGVYSPTGQYQLYVQSMEPDGVGALYIAFEQLKSKLGAEGLFSEERKKPIPPYPQSIGIITSPSGAAVQDLLNILGRRFPLAHVILYPALVQGEGAVATLVGGVRYFRTHRPDVIIIGRGGGSIEDLWCFNSEELAREIAACEVPVISAVGHETDYTICDFVSDLRAPTPSAAAELAVPSTQEVQARLAETLLRLRQGICHRVGIARQHLKQLSGSLVLTEPSRILTPYLMAVARLETAAGDALHARLTGERHKLSVLAEKLNVLSPLAVLSRGYAIALDGQGHRLRHTRDVLTGDRIDVRLADGTVRATVNETVSEDE